MENIDKTIEIMKAAMDKESRMKDRIKESIEEHKAAEEQELLDKVLSKQDGNNAVSKDNDTKMSSKACDNQNTAESTDTEATASTQKGTEADSSVEEDGKSAKHGKSLFKNNKSKELAAKDEKIEELSDRLMRSMAEFDNFRKRSEKEKSQMYDFGVKGVIEKLLPVVDNFERGLASVSEKDKDSAFAIGMEMIYKQLMNTFEEIGVKPIEAVGKEFDPAFHNAVMHGEDETLGENIISEEFQKGYIYRDLVVRHSMVKVVN